MSERIVVIGASIGGIETLSQLLPQLPVDFPAPIVVVVHTSASGGGHMLSRVLSRGSKLPISEAQDQEPLRPAQVYLPPPDHHLLVQDGQLRVSHGPRENNSRPAIDPLFRSAAYYGRENCVGVVLTGMLDDGANGLLAIRQCGGHTIVQDPLEAMYPDMPRNAMLLQQPDLVLPVSEMGQALLQAVSRLREPAPAPPVDLANEVFLTQRAMTTVAHASDMDVSGIIGEPIPLSCPDCGGTLWQVGEHFRCHVGHAYSSETLLFSQDLKLEEALWGAVRSLEEKKKTLDKIRGNEIVRQNFGMPDLYKSRADDAQRYADQIRELLLHLAKRAG